MSEVACPPRVWRFVVPVDIGALNPNKVGHKGWRYRSGHAQAHRLAGFRAWLDAGQPKCAGQVRVSYHVRRGRVLDGDNGRAGCKSVRDGILVGLSFGRGLRRVVMPALLGNDSAARVEEGPVTWETGKAYRDRPSVVVTVEEL